MVLSTTSGSVLATRRISSKSKVLLRMARRLGRGHQASCPPWPTPPHAPPQPTTSDVHHTEGLQAYRVGARVPQVCKQKPPARAQDTHGLIDCALPTMRPLDVVYGDIGDDDIEGF